MVAPFTAAPVESVTVPLMLPDVASCARAAVIAVAISTVQSATLIHPVCRVMVLPPKLLLLFLSGPLKGRLPRARL
jgi:hypothetical protein